MVLHAGNRLVSHVVIHGRSSLGPGNTVHPFSVLRGDPQTLRRPTFEPTLTIGSENTIREHVTINAGGATASGGTAVGDRNLIMSQCHIGHDSRIASNVVVGSGTCLAGHVELGNDSWIGGMCAISQRVRVGRLAFLGGHSAIDRDLPPFCVAYGDRPRRIRGINIVGLKRRGFEREDILRLIRLLRTWQDESICAPEALARVAREHRGHALAVEFVEFVSGTLAGVLR